MMFGALGRVSLICASRRGAFLYMSHVGLCLRRSWQCRRRGAAEEYTIGCMLFCQKLRVQTCRHLVNVYHISWRFLQDSVRVLTRCFRGLLGTLHRKGRSRVKLIWAEIVPRAVSTTKWRMVAAVKIRAAWFLFPGAHDNTSIVVPSLCWRLCGRLG